MFSSSHFSLCVPARKALPQTLFEWDEIKARENVKKHKVDFDEGKTIFNDLFLLTFPDTENFGIEERYINIGLSVKDRVLVLIHTERNGKIRGCSPFWVGGHHIWYISLKRIFAAVGSRRKGFPLLLFRF